ncbi:fibrinogen-like protein 1 [Palaemon carinicauda]|uniref:fibrinogen-like protein 1 n=1 Tax=Palaemon carinicauda TaxID=392227 RepID=UPI0035B5A1BE
MMWRIPVCLTLLSCVALAWSSVENDPLKPIWDGIEQLPKKILDDMQETMKSYLAEIDKEVNGKMESFKGALRSAIESQVNKSHVVKVENNLNDLMRISLSLTTAFEQFYRTRMANEYQVELDIDNQHMIMFLEETESKVARHLDQKLRKADFLFNLNGSLEDHLFEISHHQQRISDVVQALDGDVYSVWDASAGNKSDVCLAKVEDLRIFIEEERPSQQRLAEFEREWDATYQAVAGDLPRVFFYRDCSEILQSNKSAPSGVYTIYPSRDLQSGVKVWCDMETIIGEVGSAGWTVMLRRRNTLAGLLNFNRSWIEYADGFGDPEDGGEWWLGLTWVHELTYHQPYHLLFLLHEIEKGDFMAHYSNFRIESESRDFRLVVDGFTSPLVDAFGQFHHGQPFSTPDRDNDECTCNCAFNNQGGWWFNVCHRTVLTAPFPTSNDREAKTIRWLSGSWLVFDDVTMMIKPTNPE